VRVKNAEPYSLCSSNFDHIVAVSEHCLFTATMLNDICRFTIFVADVECNWLIFSRGKLTKYIAGSSLLFIDAQVVVKIPRYVGLEGLL
jgi:hypothetical protein